VTSENLRGRLRLRLGTLPGAVAVMGKWEPFLPARRCLEEVAARAAAALAVAEAMAPGGPGPFLLSAEAHLRGQPRPGCELAAEILVALGARPERIRLSAAANRTSVEVRVLDRMRRQLGLPSLLCITAAYHTERARWLARREGLSRTELQVVSCEDDLVHDALAALPRRRRQALLRCLARGHRTGSPLTLGGWNERLARLGAKWPRLEKLLADWVRGPGQGEAPMTEPGSRLSLPTVPLDQELA
jgi:hypothetical protein